MKKFVFLLISNLIISNLHSQTLTVNPNPVYQIAVSTFTIANTDSVSLFVIDLTGKIVLTLRPYSLLSAGVYQDSIILDNYSPGIYYVSLKIKSGGSQVVKLVKTGAVAINQLNLNYHVKIFPNPVQNNLCFEIDIPIPVDLNLRLSNNLGQIVFSIENFESKEGLDLSSIKSGFYYLTIKSDTAQGIFKIVKE